MEIKDLRDRSFEQKDLVRMSNGKLYWVIYETSCIAWHFLDVETFQFHVEQEIEMSSNLKIGTIVEGLGEVVEIIPSDSITITIEKR